MTKQKTIKTDKEPIEGTNSVKPPVINEQQQNTGNGMDEDFAKFKQTTSTFVPDPETTGIPNTGIGTITKLVTPTPEQLLKIQLFAGFALYMIAGLNTFIFNKIKKTNVPLEEMLLSDDEEKALLPYLNSTEILMWIDKLPIWAVGILHMEYMFFIKYNSVKDEYKITKKEKVIESKNDTKTKGGKK